MDATAGGKTDPLKLPRKSPPELGIRGSAYVAICLASRNAPPYSVDRATVTDDRALAPRGQGRPEMALQSGVVAGDVTISKGAQVIQRIRDTNLKRLFGGV